jgi:uncharacterized protein
VPPPSQRLPEAAKVYWRFHGAMQGAGAVIAALVFAGPLGDFAWLAVVAAIVLAVVAAAVVPELRWRRWRYEVRDEEVDLLRGTFVARRTIIPIRRVQHVDTESGPLQDSLGLATVTFHTAAGGVGIPALGKGEAERVRSRVAELARTRDDT